MTQYRWLYGVTMYTQTASLISFNQKKSVLGRKGKLMGRGWILATLLSILMWGALIGIIILIYNLT
jgi:hypothetical protein